MNIFQVSKLRMLVIIALLIVAGIASWQIQIIISTPKGIQTLNNQTTHFQYGGNNYTVTADVLYQAEPHLLFGNATGQVISCSLTSASVYNSSTGRYMPVYNSSIIYTSGATTKALYAMFGNLTFSNLGTCPTKGTELATGIALRPGVTVVTTTI